MTRRAASLAVAACALVGTVVRAIPCWGDLWLDEIWTWADARRLHSALDVFTRIHHSNNHHLNTLLFYWLGDERAGATYRMPALVAGAASIVLAAQVGARRGRLEQVLAAAIAAASFPLVHYSSEARGYAFAVCFALAALLALLRFVERGGLGAAAFFAAATCLGILSQLVFVFFWCGTLAWTALRLARRPGPRARALADGLLLHAAPALGLALLYAVDLRHLTVGGGPPAVPAEVVARTLGFSLGLPVRPGLAPLYAALATGLLGLGLVRLARDGDDLWLLWLVAIVVAPAAILARLRPEVVDLRYFLVGIALFLILLAWILAAELRAGGARRALAIAALALFLVGNAVHTARFLALGRGGFQAALAFMAERTDGGRIVVGSDHDFRNGLVLRFYARGLPPGKVLDYRERGRWPPGGPEWIVTHRRFRPARPLPEIAFDAAGRYRLVAEFDHAGISGFYWALYRRVDAAPGAGAASTPPRRRRTTSPKPSPPNGSGPIRATRS